MRNINIEENDNRIIITLNEISDHKKSEFMKNLTDISYRCLTTKHTCGIDGDPGAVAPLNGVCIACQEYEQLKGKTNEPNS